MELFEIMLSVLFILNILVSTFLIIRDDLDIIQKTCQVVIVWAIPFLGGIGLWLFHRTQDFPVKPIRPNFGGGPSDNSGAAGGDS